MCARLMPLKMASYSLSLTPSSSSSSSSSPPPPLPAPFFQQSFKNIKTYLDFAHSSKENTVLVGGGADDR